MVFTFVWLPRKVFKTERRGGGCNSSRNDLEHWWWTIRTIKIPTFFLGFPNEKAKIDGFSPRDARFEGLQK